MSKCPGCDVEVDYLIFWIDAPIMGSLSLIDGEESFEMHDKLAEDEPRPEYFPETYECPHCGYEFKFSTNKEAIKFLKEKK